MDTFLDRYKKYCEYADGVPGAECPPSMFDEHGAENYVALENAVRVPKGFNSLGVAELYGEDSIGTPSYSEQAYTTSKYAKKNIKVTGGYLTVAFTGHPDPVGPPGPIGYQSPGECPYYKPKNLKHDGK